MNGNAGEEQHEGREQEAVKAQHQQNAKVDLQRSGDDLRLVQIKVVGQHQAGNRDAGDLQVSLLVVQGEVSICRAAQSNRGYQEAATDDDCFAEKQNHCASWVIDP